MEEERHLLVKERGECQNRFDEGGSVGDHGEDAGQEDPNMPDISNDHGAPPDGLGCPGDQAGPDGGWGWLVVIACFAATFTLDGIGYRYPWMEPLMQG